ncbi:glutamate 5-kinase [Aquimonas sp.]|jgi:glutamate 5-kinase|uniref:glutamate 5-kinase n=1 Tax=Aquimonas sp. TaxID=1872588 RepID=UPI0037BFAF22
MSRQRIVVKFGTSTVTAGGPGPDLARLQALSAQLATLRQAGHDVVLVSSGAVATGRSALKAAPARDVPVKQMHAAVGQPRLHAIYQGLFADHAIDVAQVLLTRSDVENRRRYLNAREALLTMLAHGVLPIVNENDTVATEELRLGDNDMLSALVCSLVDADRLILLTDQAGLYDSDPRGNPAARLISEVGPGALPEQLRNAAGGSGRLGTGGMATKLGAAELARRGGATAHIASGAEPEVLTRLLAGESIGTRFAPQGERLAARKRYITGGGAPRGALQIDAGAASALRRGGSLLPVGLVEVQGSFDRGDPVQVLDAVGTEVARGIAAYAAVDLQRLCRRRSEEIEGVLGYRYGDEVIHRSDLVLSPQAAAAPETAA